MILDIYDELAADVRQLNRISGIWYRREEILRVIKKYKDLPPEDIADETDLSVYRVNKLRKMAGLPPYKAEAKRQRLEEIKRLRLTGPQQIQERYEVSETTAKRLLKLAQS